MGREKKIEQGEEAKEKVEIKGNGGIENFLYQIPVEKPLLTTEDLKFIEKMMKKRENETEIKVGDQAWEIKVFDKKNFDLGNIYQDFLAETEPKLLKSLTYENLNETEESNIKQMEQIEKNEETNIPVFFSFSF